MIWHNAQYAFDLYASSIWVHILCIMHYAIIYFTLYIAFCINIFIKYISWCFPWKMTRKRPNVCLIFVCMHAYKCIYYPLCIMQLKYIPCPGKFIKNSSYFLHKNNSPQGNCTFSDIGVHSLCIHYAYIMYYAIYNQII